MHPAHEDNQFSEFAIPEEWKVPRGTNEKLLIYYELIQKWNARINLVSEKTFDKKTFWARHALDSLQLVTRIQSNEVVVDIGSGAGFPALVLAAAGYTAIHCVESDRRKCEFIKEAARQMGVGVNIHNKRIEALNHLNIGNDVNVISARACAELSELLSLSASLLTAETRYELLKGKRVEEEVEGAKKHWQFDYKLTPSNTDDSAHIITIRNVVKRGKNGLKN